MSADFLQFDATLKAFTENPAGGAIGLFGSYESAVTPTDNNILVNDVSKGYPIVTESDPFAAAAGFFALVDSSANDVLRAQGSFGSGADGEGVYVSGLFAVTPGTSGIGTIVNPFASVYSHLLGASNGTILKTQSDVTGVHLASDGALTWVNNTNLGAGATDLSITRSAASKYLLNTATHTTYIQFGGTTNAFLALNNATLNDASGVGLLCRLADDSDNAGFQGSRYLAMGTGGGGGVFAIRTAGVDQLFIDGTGVYIQSTAIHAWSSSGNALGSVDVVMKRPGAGTLEFDLDPGSGRTQAVAWSFTGVNNDTTMVLTCRIAGVETQKRVTRDPITNALFAV